MNTNDYTHPMADIRTAEDLAKFVASWKPGKPSVKLLRRTKNPFWFKITNLGPLPRIKAKTAATVAKFPECKETWDSVRQLFQNVENKDGSQLSGFWVHKGVLYLVYKNENVKCAMLKITHPFVSELVGDGHYIDAAKTDETEDFVEKLGFIGLSNIPYTSMLMPVPHEHAGASLRMGTFKATHLLQYLYECRKYTEIFDDDFRNCIRIGDGFFKPSILADIVETMAKLDNDVQLWVPSSMMIQDRDRSQLFLTSQHITATVMPMNMREKSDTMTHHVLSTFVPEGATDSWRWRVNTLHACVDRQSNFLKEAAISFDRKLKEIENHQKGIAGLMSELDELHVTLQTHGVYPELPDDEFQSRCLFEQEVFGAKFAREEKVGMAIHEATQLSDELRKKLLNWLMEGQDITEACFQYLEQFRPRYVEKPVQYIPPEAYFQNSEE